jgi:diadenosine tetraphosphatase ApaH/serine/threonine PP2A family protein phosphatase
VRYAILSDVHGNLEALTAVLLDIQQASDEYGARIDQIWCLGDVVGYGPDPGECLRRIRRRCDICIPGNHDWAAVGQLNLDDFSHGAAESARWTREQLVHDEQNYLKHLPQVTCVGHFTLAHGSPSNPIWEYITTAAVAAPNFAAFDTLVCVVGHSHLPAIFIQPSDAREVAAAPIHRATQREVALAMAQPGGPTRTALEADGNGANGGRTWGQCRRILPGMDPWRLPQGHRAIVNPGSVGQPRDGDPRAAYMIFDTTFGFEFRRVPYDVAATQRKIRERGLSASLAERLARGT